MKIRIATVRAVTDETIAVIATFAFVEVQFLPLLFFEFDTNGG